MNDNSPPSDGNFTKIPNAFLDAMAQGRIRVSESRVLFVIARKTWGFRKQEDRISLSQFVGFTGMKKQNVSRALQWLVRRKIVIRRDYRYRINEIYTQWEESSHAMTGRPGSSHLITEVIERDNEVSSDLRTTKERDTKENVQKKEAKASGAKRPGDKAEGRKFPDGKPDPRRPEVTAILDHIKSAFDLPVLDGGETKNRRAAWQLLVRVKKLYEGGGTNEQAMHLITTVIFAAKHDDWWRNHLTSAILLNDKFMMIGKTSIARMTGQDANSRKGPRVYNG